MSATSLHDDFLDAKKANNDSDEARCIAFESILNTCLGTLQLDWMKQRRKNKGKERAHAEAESASSLGDESSDEDLLEGTESTHGDSSESSFSDTSVAAVGGSGLHSIAMGRGKGNIYTLRRKMEEAAKTKEERKSQKRKAQEDADKLARATARKRARRLREGVIEKPQAKPAAKTNHQVRLQDEVAYKAALLEKAKVLFENPDDPDGPKNDTIRVDIRHMEVDDKAYLSREATRSHIEVLKNRMKRNPEAIVVPWLCVVKDLAKPEDFDIKVLHRDQYTLIPIGGQHSMIASKELLAGADESSDARSITSWKYRNTILLADNLTKQEFKKLGMDHNKDSEFRKSLSFMEKVKIFHAEKQSHDMSTKEGRQQWKQSCLRMTEQAGVGKSGAFSAEILNRNSTQFGTAAWSDENWQLLLLIDDMYSNFRLKDQHPPKRKGTKKDNMSLASTLITKLNGVQDDKLHNLLQKIVNKDLTLTTAAIHAIQSKKVARVTAAAQHVCGFNSMVETENYFTKNRILWWANIFASIFSRNVKVNNLPANFVKSVMTTKQHIELSQQDATAAAKDGKHIVVKSSDRIALRYPEFRGQFLDLIARETTDEAGDAGQEPPREAVFAFNPASRNFVNFIKGDAKNLNSLQMEEVKKHLEPSKAKAMNFPLVMLDPPYGKTAETWDKKAWTPEDFISAVIAAMTVNTADGFNFVSFCSAEQLSGVMAKFIDFPVEPEKWKITVQHAVWNKEGSFDQRKSINCQNIWRTFFRDCQLVDILVIFVTYL